MVERDPNDDKNVIVEIRAGDRGRRGGAVRRRPLQDAHPLRRASAASRPRRSRSRRPRSAASRRSPSRSRATAPTRSSSTRAARTASSACPKTESQGRIHTSTATVAVLPEAEEVEVEIDQNDLQIDVYRSSGPGRPVGQHDRLGGADHPQADRDRRLDAGREVPAPEPRARRCGCCARGCSSASSPSSRRRSPPSARPQVGSGERSEKIRTYNFPQGRVTDHRIKLTAHNLDEVLGGELDEFTDALAAEEKRRAARGPGRRRLSHGGPAAAGDACRRRARAPPTMRSAAAGVRRRRGSTPSCCWPRRRVRSRAALADGPGRAASPARRRRAFRRDGAAPGAARAGRLHPRPQGLPPHRARGRLGGC